MINRGATETFNGVMVAFLLKSECKNIKVVPKRC